jgi:gliding motility-associated-like protein
VSGSGGTGPITFTIVPAVAQPTAGNFIDLCAGINYVITGTDGNGCTATTNITLSTPNSPIITVTAQTPVTCFGLCDGTAQLTIVPGITYTIAGSGTPILNSLTGAITGLCSGANGSYTITGSDANSCLGTTVINIAYPAVLTLAINTTTNPTCNPGCDGTTTIITTGGNGTNVFTIAPSGTINANTGAASALCAGTTYTITVTDINNCTAQTTILLNTPASPTIAISAIVNPTIPLVCDGSALATGAGGLAPYTYAITAPGVINATTGAISALCDGCYTVTVTDANGCTETTTFCVSAVVLPCAVTAVGTDESCFGACDGTAQATPIGGVPAYTYAIAPSGTINVTGLATGLCAGTYTITATDNNSCSTTTTVVIGGPTQVVASVTSSTQPSCTLGCDGVVVISAVGGAAGYTYSIAPNAGIVQAPAGTFTGLCAGTNYVITATDANGCTGTTNISLSTPNSPIVTITAQTPVTCFGDCDGTAQLTIAAGITYTIAGSGTPLLNSLTGAITGLCGGANGSYTITGTDANSCVGTTVINIIEPAQLTLAINTSTQPSCNPGCDGTATITTTGGNGTNVFTIAPSGTINSTTGDVSALCDGITYTITVTDVNGCTSTTSISPVAPVAPVIVVTASTDPTCIPGCDGTVQVTFIVGANYTISGFGSPTITAGGLASGLCSGSSYTITATANNCSGTTTVLLNAPNAPSINVTATTPPTCSPGCDGTATVTSIVGGSYTISPSGTINAATGAASALCAGTIYTIQVTDANGCTGQTTVLLVAPTPPTVTIPTQVNPSTPLACDGTGTAAAAGGTPGYTYSIAGTGTPVINPATGAMSNLCGACYTVTVTDANGCTGTTSFCLANPLSVTAVGTDVACFGDCNGTGQATGNGGAGGFTYAISATASIDANTGAITNMCANTVYIITVTDANFITATITLTIGQPTQVNFNAPVVVSPSCNPGCDGTITVSATGGTAGYTYTLNSPVGSICTPAQAVSGTFTNIGTGTYTVTVTDANGCTNSTAIIVNPLTGPSITSLTITNVTCNGLCNGSITVNGTGATSYSINPSPATNATGVFNGLCPNTYVVTASDASGCTAASTGTITEPPVLQTNTATSTNVTCNGLNNGTITYNVTGGTGAINYTSAPALVGVGGVYTNVAPNTYVITATDANGCTMTASFTITQPNALQITNATSTSTLCSGQANGTITLNITGGTALYSATSGAISVGPAASPLTLSGFGPATYLVTVTDANGCTITTNVNVAGSTPIVYTSATATNANCNNACNGAINVTTTGGFGTITYTINPQGPQSNTTGNFTALCAGTFTVTATDGNGCTETTPLTLVDPLALVISNATSTNPLCFGNASGTISMTLSGGTIGAGYTFTSSPVATQPTPGNFTGLTAQCYTITGVDGNGCTVTTQICLTNPAQLVWDNPVGNNVLCNGGTSGSIVAPALGGTGTVTYTLNPSAQSNTTGTFGGLTAQCYTVSATDVNGCNITTVICITEPSVLTIGVPAVVNILCNGSATGSISINANGGTPTYTYSINPNLGTQATAGNFINVPAGTYAIIVTDVNGCTSISSGIQISEPPAITFNTVNVQDVACYGDATGTITVGAQGGVGGFTYSLNPAGAQPTPGFFNTLFAGTYIATVTDANGCTMTTSIEVKQNPQLIITNVSLTEPICFGESNGAISVTAAGGVAPIQFSLNNSPFQNNGTFANIPAGYYVMTLRDVLGCMRDSLIQLTQPEEVGATIDLTGANCVDSKDGKAIITGTGGRGGYKYYLSPGLYINKSGVFTGLEAGTYTLRVVDTTGCEYSTFFTVNPPASALGNYITKQDLACNGKGNEGLATANVSGGTPPYSYLWNTSPAQSTPTASTLYFGLYKVEITDAYGCKIKDSVYIEEGPCCDIAFIPNAFSPNGDGNNDEFRVLTTAGVQLIQLEVYNRWGNKVWSTSDYRKGWDGYDNGQEAPVDTYQYILRYTCTRDGNTYIKKGDVILVR